MSKEILTREEYGQQKEWCENGDWIAHDETPKLFATIEALAEALRITERVLVENTAEETEMAEQLRSLRKLGWLDD